MLHLSHEAYGANFITFQVALTQPTPGTAHLDAESVKTVIIHSDTNRYDLSHFGVPGMIRDTLLNVLWEGVKSALRSTIENLSIGVNCSR